MTRVLPDRVVIISDFSHVRGGASKLAVTEAGLLVAQGVAVTFFAEMTLVTCQRASKRWR